MYSITIPATASSSLKFYGVLTPTYTVEPSDAVAFVEFMNSHVMPHMADESFMGRDLIVEVHTLIAKAIVAHPGCAASASAALVFIDEVEGDTECETAWLKGHGDEFCMVNLGI